MRAHFGLPSVENDEVEGKPPITVKFEIPYFTVSGIQVCERAKCIFACAFALNLCSLFHVPEFTISYAVHISANKQLYISYMKGSIHEDY